MVKEKLATGAGTIADTARSAKEKTVKDAKKTKQTTSGFLSGVAKSAKHAIEDATGDVKEFMEETKQETAAEEARTKSDIAQAKDKSTRVVSDVKQKSVGAVKDTKKKITQKVSKPSKDAHVAPASTGEVSRKLSTETRKLSGKVGSGLAGERVREVVVRRSGVAGKPETSDDVEHLTESVRVKKVSRIPQKRISPGKETTSDVTLDASGSRSRVVETVSTTIGHPEPRTRHSVTTVVTKSSVQTTPPPPSSLAEFTDSRTEDVTEEAARRAQNLAEQAYTSAKAETHGMVQSVYSGKAIEVKTRTKTPSRASCVYWMSIAVAVLVLLVALIVALEPQMLRRVYTLSNNAPRQAGI
ncbi:hypothetical protein X777_02506 [Ooceraea biroi]|uniref:Uncharacterized protein n=1 Tax=Ooceraea biroi TaxID=2015173 RepID=A0A026WMJ9_OOCBI|nr:hypothetical protein X777_02506 [Ooceraea biroi]